MLALLAVVAAPNYPCFVGAWIFAGFAMSGVFYAPAFAALTRFFAADAVRALTVLTLVAGLASTVFAPLTAVLASQMSWQHTYLVLAAVIAVVTIPAHLIGLRRPWPPIIQHPRCRGANPHRPQPPLHRTDRSLRPGCPRVVRRHCQFGAVDGPARISTGAAAVALGLGGAGQVLGGSAIRLWSDGSP